MVMKAVEKMVNNASPQNRVAVDQIVKKEVEVVQKAIVINQVDQRLKEENRALLVQMEHFKKKLDLAEATTQQANATAVQAKTMSKNLNDAERKKIDDAFKATSEKAQKMKQRKDLYKTKLNQLSSELRKKEAERARLKAETASQAKRIDSLNEELSKSAREFARQIEANNEAIRQYKEAQREANHKEFESTIHSLTGTNTRLIEEFENLQRVAKANADEKDRLTQLMDDASSWAYTMQVAYTNLKISNDEMNIQFDAAKTLNTVMFEAGRNQYNEFEAYKASQAAEYEKMKEIARSEYATRMAQQDENDQKLISAQNELNQAISVLAVGNQHYSALYSQFVSMGQALTQNSAQHAQLLEQYKREGVKNALAEAKLQELEDHKRKARYALGLLDAQLGQAMNENTQLTGEAKNFDELQQKYKFLLQQANQSDGHLNNAHADLAKYETQAKWYKQKIEKLQKTVRDNASKHRETQKDFAAMRSTPEYQAQYPIKYPAGSRYLDGSTIENKMTNAEIINVLEQYIARIGYGVDWSDIDEIKHQQHDMLWKIVSWIRDTFETVPDDWTVYIQDLVDNLKKANNPTYENEIGIPASVFF